MSLRFGRAGSIEEAAAQERKRRSAGKMPLQDKPALQNANRSFASLGMTTSVYDRGRLLFGCRGGSIEEGTIYRAPTCARERGRTEVPPLHNNWRGRRLDALTGQAGATKKADPSLRSG